MNEEEQILGMFVNGLSLVTGTKVADETRQKIMKFKKQFWIISIGVWSIILLIFIARVSIN